MATAFWQSRGLPRPKSMEEAKARGFQILLDEQRQRIDRLREGRLRPQVVDLARDVQTGQRQHVSASTQAQEPQIDEKQLQIEREKLREELLRPGRNIRGDRVRHGDQAKFEEHFCHGECQRVVWQGEGPSLKAQRRASLPVATTELQGIISSVEEELSRKHEGATPALELAEAAAADESRAIGEAAPRREHLVTEFVRPTKDGKERWKGKPLHDELWHMGFSEGERQRMRADVMGLRGEDCVWPPVEEGKEPVVTTDERAGQEALDIRQGKQVDFREGRRSRQYAGARSPAEVQRRFVRAQELAQGGKKRRDEAMPSPTPTTSERQRSTTEGIATTKAAELLVANEKAGGRLHKDTAETAEGVVLAREAGRQGDARTRMHLL